MVNNVDVSHFTIVTLPLHFEFEVAHNSTRKLCSPQSVYPVVSNELCYHPSRSPRYHNTLEDAGLIIIISIILSSCSSNQGLTS